MSATDTRIERGRAVFVTRSCLLVGLVMLLQVTAFSRLSVIGVRPDLAMLTGIAVGLDRGTGPGTLVGFLAGLSFDLFVDTPFGLAAAVYGLVGYGCGIAHDRIFPGRDALSASLVFAATTAATTMVAMASYVTDGIARPGLTRFIALIGVGSAWNLLFVRFIRAIVSFMFGGPRHA